MAVITISRQYGSGGDEIGLRVAEILGYRYFDKQAIFQAAEAAGLVEDDVLDYTEDQHRLQSFLDRLFRRSRPVAQVRVWREDSAGVRVAETDILDERRAIDLVRTAIEAAYRRGNIVIVGRGGQAVLNDKPGVLHVRVEAPLNVRVTRLKTHKTMMLAEAIDVIAKHDEVTRDYLRRFYDIEWSNPLLYHMILNTGRLTVEASAHLVVEAVSQLIPAGEAS